jgi:diguanylate cyclase (GGDEF)-like protein
MATDGHALLDLLAFQAGEALVDLREHKERQENMRLAMTQRLQLEALLQASADVYSSRQLDEVLQQIALAISSASGFGGVVVYLYDERTDLLHARAFVGVSSHDIERMRESPLPFSTFRPLMRPEIQISRSYVYDHRKYELPPELLASLSVPDVRDWKEGQWHPLDSLTIPLQDREGRTIGLLSMDEPSDKRFPDLTKLQALELFADACAVAIQQARLHDEIQQLAMTDPLTGLHNRRALEDVLRRELAQSRRNGLPCSILFCDLDHFKLVNDALGHAVGDQVLQSVAALFRQRLRRGDLAARYGGEEFVVVLPVTQPDQAVEVADNLRQRVASHPWPTLPTDTALTISVGVASTVGCPTVSETELIEAADRALYTAKQQGRNRVSMYGGDPA